MLKEGRKVKILLNVVESERCRRRRGRSRKLLYGRYEWEEKERKVSPDLEFFIDRRGGVVVVSCDVGAGVSRLLYTSSSSLSSPINDS